MIGCMIGQRTGATKLPFLDGLRAYSILTVILGHAIPGAIFLQTNSFLFRCRWFLLYCISNAELGVRIFFVLSGFLICALLLEEEDATGRISIRGFYERRIARIFPAFYLYVATVAVLVVIHVASVPLSTFAAASTFTYNLDWLWRHGGPADHSTLFSHFWTLSIEEQFYLLWPSILVFLGRRWALRLAVLCVTALPLIRAVAYQIFLVHPMEPLRTGILMRTSQDMIMWGVLGAFAVRHGALDRLRAHRFRWLCPWASLSVFFVVTVLIETYPYFGLDSSLLPTLQCLATLLLLFWLLTGEGGFLRRLLASWPMVQLGLLSYSLYVWQQLFLKWPGMSWLPALWKILLLFAVSIVSYRLVESPMRSRIRRWFSQPELAH